jgi:hypothetical protein
MMMMMMMVLSILQQQKHDYGDDPSQMQMSETRGKKKTHTHRSFHRTWDSKSLFVCVGFWVFRGFRGGG